MAAKAVTTDFAIYFQSLDLLILPTYMFKVLCQSVWPGLVGVPLVVWPGAQLPRHQGKLCSEAGEAMIKEL